MEISWSGPASSDLERIYWRIRESNPEAAHDVILAIYQGCSALAAFPDRGRKGRIAGWRELVFTSLPYIAVYRVNGQDVEIARIYHTAQDWH
jgi:toxin ParE1/3/4